MWRLITQPRPGDDNANDIHDGNDGTLQGGTTFVPGMVGQAFSLDGVDDEISIAHTSGRNFGPNDSFTVDAWLKASTSVLGTQRVAVSLTYVCSPETISLILLTDGRIDFEIRDSDNISVNLTSPASIVDGQWHHIAGVRDVGSDTVELYLDGSLVDSLPDTTTGTFTRADAQDRIGSIPVACPTNRYFWAGEIDEVEIFNRALSDGEIQAVFNAGSAGKCKKELTFLKPATLWVGLKNSDDQGTQFDLRTEVYIKDTLVAEGETRCITGVTRNPNKAKEVSVNLGSISDGGFASGDELSLRVLTRIGTNPDDTKCSGHNNAVGLRLYDDAVSRPSRFGAEIPPDPLTDLFLHSSGTDFFLDATPPTATSVKFKDSSFVNFVGGNPWKEIGIWSMPLP